MIMGFFKALAQIADPRFRRVLLLGLAGAAAGFVILQASVWWLLSAVTFFSTVYAEWTVDVLGGAAAFVLGVLLFPAIAGLVIGFLLDDVVSAVEARHYADLPAPRPQPLWETISTAATFAIVLIVVNMVALPFYLFVPGLNLVLFYLVNGYLLGREFFEMVALRRLPAAEAKALRRTRQGWVWLAGAVIAFMLSIPFVNLAAPVIAAAFMTHVFERLRRAPGPV